MTGVRVELPDDLVDELVELVTARVVERLRDGTEQTSGSRWLTISEAATHLRCAKHRIYDLRSSGRLSRHADGTRALVDRVELDILVETDRVAQALPTPARSGGGREVS